MKNLSFDDKILVKKHYVNWCKENQYKEGFMSLMVYIQSKGWLNEEKIKSDLVS